MSDLVLDDVTKRFGAHAAVDGVGLEVPHGTFVCLLGPSGCGKTTLLRLIAGLKAPDRGAIRLDGADITAVPAHRRDFGVVFQSLALFPYLNVGDNIAYPLRIRGVQAGERARRVAELLELVRLPGLAGRPVAKLSGGQRQRVAIARALALSPRLFLLDEPLSALDAKLREAMQVELRRLQERLGITTVLVTHDQREAMTMADIVVVMGDGRIHQVAPPVQIYRRPANRFVADFIGRTNLLQATPGQGHAVVEGATLEGLEVPAGGATVTVRPEDIALVPPGEGTLTGRITFVRDLGASVETYVDVAGREFVVVGAPRTRHGYGPGDAVGVEIPAAACVVLPA